MIAELCQRVLDRLRMAADWAIIIVISRVRVTSGTAVAIEM